jgi:hypothetical protein
MLSSRTKQRIHFPKDVPPLPARQGAQRLCETTCEAGAAQFGTRRAIHCIAAGQLLGTTRPGSFYFLQPAGTFFGVSIQRILTNAIDHFLFDGHSSVPRLNALMATLGCLHLVERFLENR